MTRCSSELKRIAVCASCTGRPKVNKEAAADDQWQIVTRTASMGLTSDGVNSSCRGCGGSCCTGYLRWTCVCR